MSTDRDNDGIPTCINYTRNNYEEQTYLAAKPRVGAASSSSNNVANSERFILVELYFIPLSLFDNLLFDFIWDVVDGQIGGFILVLHPEFGKVVFVLVISACITRLNLQRIKAISV